MKALIRVNIRPPAAMPESTESLFEAAPMAAATPASSAAYTASVALKQAAIAHTLSLCPMFSGLPPADLEALAELTVVKTLPRGEYVFEEGDPCQGFYVVQRGAICLHRIIGEGKQQVLHVFRENESFGEGALIMNGGYPADARAEEPSQVLLIARLGFLAMIREHPDLALRIMTSLAMHNRLLLNQMEDLASKDVECRLAGWLLKRCPNPRAEAPATIELTVSRRALAAELGTAPETLSRAQARLRSQGLLSANGKSVTVLEPVKLAAFLRARLGMDP
jgi:CRP/FNR family transcriptional regulator